MDIDANREASGPCLLHIESSARRESDSVSRQLGAAFTTGWRATNPDGVVVHRDLALSPVPHQDEAGWMAGLIPEVAHDDDQRASWAISRPLVEELEAADEFLFSVPMYNLSVPSTFKAWIDRVVQVGRTVRLDGQPQPLRGRRATVVAAVGGGYTGTPRAALDHHEPYLRTLLAFLGLEDIEVIRAELTLAGLDPNMAGLEHLRDASLEAALKRADARGRVVTTSQRPVALT
jgi:FMN-dependent NADH-azoreductase